METMEECEDYLAQVGMVSVFAWKSGHFSSLLEAAGGKLEGSDPGFQRIWRWKDELPARRVAWAGRLLGQQVLLVHHSLLPALLGWRGRLDLSELYQDGMVGQPAMRLYQVLQKASQPLGRRHLRQALGFAAPVFERACRDLERMLLLTRAQSDPQPQGWDSNSYALVEQHFPDLTPLPRAQAQTCLRQAFARAAPTASSAQIERWLKTLG